MNRDLVRIKHMLDGIDEIALENAQVLKLYEDNAFFIKHQVEIADTKSNFLIYSPLPKPLPRDNWLLDMHKYSKEFSTDKAVLTMRDSGVKDPALIHTFRRYLKFFDNKERYRKFASYGLDTFTEERIHIAVMSVYYADCRCQTLSMSLGRSSSGKRNPTTDI